ncbi:MAG TPA: multicopper oxidase domain-containing protein, partial [Anaeromyxobacteraceae bacterium]
TDIYQVVDGGAVGRRLELLLNGLHFHDPITEQPHVGAVEDWTIVNTTGDTHPMHLHLVAFEVLEKGSYDPALFTPAASGRLPVVLPGALHPDEDPKGLLQGDPGFDPSFTVRDNEQGLKDTVRVPPGGYVTLRARFDRLGVYMWHCHILSHEDHEMMRPFQVVP